MTLPVLFWRKEKELFCTVSKKKSKKKKSKAYLPTLFFSGKEPETQLFFFFGPIDYVVHKSIVATMSVRFRLSIPF